MPSHAREPFPDAAWEAYLARWRRGAYRAAFFHEMVLAELRRAGPMPSVLDIGCGRGFDGDPGLQALLAARAGEYIGIEPDRSVSAAAGLAEVHRCTLEASPVTADSIDVAFAVFVIEHLPQPRLFFDKLWQVLVPGGVFWGFTIDLRHYFAILSLVAEGAGLKDWLLKRAGGADGLRGGNRYRAYYRANTPRAIGRYAARFRSVRTMNLYQRGQFDAYLPRWARPIGRWFDGLTATLGFPGPMLVVRLEK